MGGSHLYGVTFGILFGALSTAGQVFAYNVGIRPTVDYKPARRPRVTRFQMLSCVNRGFGYGVGGYVSALLAHPGQRGIAIGLRTGLALGLVTLMILYCTPLIEWAADHVPEKRMGVLGVGLILIGFGLQSVQYWVALLDVNVR